MHVAPMSPAFTNSTKGQRREYRELARFLVRIGQSALRNPLISSTCRSNSLRRLRGNFVERIRNQKRDNGEPETTEQRKLERRRTAACCGDSYRFPSGDYSDPFQSPRSLIVGPVSSAPIPLHPAPYRIIVPDQTICRVPIGNSNSIVANRRFRYLRTKRENLRTLIGISSGKGTSDRSHQHKCQVSR